MINALNVVQVLLAAVLEFEDWAFVEKWAVYGIDVMHSNARSCVRVI